MARDSQGYQVERALTRRAALGAVLLHRNVGVEMVERAVCLGAVREAVLQRARVSTQLEDDIGKCEACVGRSVGRRRRDVKVLLLLSSLFLNPSAVRTLLSSPHISTEKQAYNSPAAIQSLNLIVSPSRPLLHCIPGQGHKTVRLARLSSRPSVVWLQIWG